MLFPLSFTPRPLYYKYPFNSRLCGLQILFACFRKEKIRVPFLGVKPRSFGFTTCSLVTIMTVPLPASVIRNSVSRTVEEALHGTACISILSSTSDF